LNPAHTLTLCFFNVQLAMFIQLLNSGLGGRYGKETSYFSAKAT